MLLDKINADLKEAMFARNELRVSTLRFLLSAIKNEEIALRVTLTDEQILTIINRQVKQRKESIESFEKGNRVDLAEREKRELEILQNYLPEQLSEEELRRLVEEEIKQTGASVAADLGKVMGGLKAKLAGKADMGKVAQIVRESLGV